MKLVRIAVPDLVSNSYFPAIAAIELGCFREHGLDAIHELIFPNYRAYEVLRDGAIDFVAGPAHAALPAFPEWRGAKLLAALAQGMHWLLVMHSDIAAEPGDVNAVKGRTIGAAALVDLVLERMLVEAGIDLERDRVRIVAFQRRTSRACRSASRQRARSSRANWTGSGRMRWVPRMRCGEESARSCSMSGAESDLPSPSTIQCRCWRRAIAPLPAIRT